MKLTFLPLIFAILLASTSLFAQNNYEILLHTGNETFPENVRTYPDQATISEQEMIDGNYYRMLQFHQLPTQSILDELSNRNIELLEYIPNKAYLASIPSTYELADLEDLNVRSIIDITPELKLSTDLKSETLPNWATSRGQVEVMVKYHKNIKHDNNFKILSGR